MGRGGEGRDGEGWKEGLSIRKRTEHALGSGSHPFQLSLPSLSSAVRPAPIPPARLALSKPMGCLSCHACPPPPPCLGGGLQPSGSCSCLALFVVSLVGGERSRLDPWMTCSAPLFPQLQSTEFGTGSSEKGSPGKGSSCPSQAWGRGRPPPLSLSAPVTVLAQPHSPFSLAGLQVSRLPDGGREQHRGRTDACPHIQQPQTWEGQA